MTLNTLIPLLLGGLPPELISKLDAAQLEKLTRGLPLASGGILELPISANAGPVGLGICLTQKDGGFSLLEDPEANFQAPTASKTWSALKEFALAHKQTSSLLRRAVSQSWVEFDFAPKMQKLSLAGFFFKLEEPFNRPPTAAVVREKAGANTVALTEKALELLDVPVNPASIQTLLSCIHARNASTRIAYVGAMFGRGTPGFRLVLADMPFYSLTGYLKKINYPHRRGMLPLVDFLTTRSGLETVSLHLDINGDVQPRLGLEVAMNPGSNLLPAWRAFLDQLIHTGASTPAKAKALPAWIRQFDRTQLAEKWPEALGIKYGSLHCSINHLKFSYQPGYFSQEVPPGDFGATLASQAHAGEISTKAYLAYQFAVRSAPAQPQVVGVNQ